MTSEEIRDRVTIVAALNAGERSHRLTDTTAVPRLELGQHRQQVRGAAAEDASLSPVTRRRIAETAPDPDVTTPNGRPRGWCTCPTRSPVGCAEALVPHEPSGRPPPRRPRP